MTEKISKFKQLKNDKVERLLDERRAQRAKLNDKMKDCSQFLKSSHVVKIIEERQDRRDELNESMGPLSNSELLVPGIAKIHLHLLTGDSYSMINWPEL